MEYTTRLHSFDLNVPWTGQNDHHEKGAGFAVSSFDNHMVTRKRKRGVGGRVNARVYHDCSSTKGGIVKALGDVIRVRTESRERPPNVICKVEYFGKICGSLDQKCPGWVCEMGFGSLLFLVHMKLPRSLCYWLMTRIDPINERLIVGGMSYRLTCNQVRWVLGLPKGEKPLPWKFSSDYYARKVSALQEKYGQVWTSVEGRSGKVVRRTGFAVTPIIVDRLMSKFEDHEAEEFKVLFLIAALDMVLCPTQCNRFPKELMPALSYVGQARSYNWCALVLDKLMASVKRFGYSFYADGFAGGCGGCTLFVAIFYLDRLDRNATQWGIRPRLKAWTNEEMKRACDDDRVNENGDFGSLGVLDVAYGEKHPHDAKDAEYPSDDDAI